MAIAYAQWNRWTSNDVLKYRVVTTEVITTSTSKHQRVRCVKNSLVTDNQ